MTRKTQTGLRPPEGLPPGERWRSAIATDPAKTRGRLQAEASSPTRSDFQRDRDRIIHSAAFRRLKHKTQVFLEHEGDHYRTRLTHTLEVAQIARSLARALGLDEDLAETLALAHDLGHTPFGHAGERALQRANAAAGGFDHNAQSLKVVTALERRYAGFDGLNLTWETLEGLVKHNGPLVNAKGKALPKHDPLPAPIVVFDKSFPLDLWSQAGPEAQAAAIADDIAYNAHDIDDGLRAGILDLKSLENVPFLAGLLEDIRRKHASLDPSRTTHELQRRIITSLVEDVIHESFRLIEASGAGDVEGIRALPHAVVAFSSVTTQHVRDLRAFLFPQLYRNARIMAQMSEAERIVEQLYAHYHANPADLPEEWRLLAAKDTPTAISDFIAGMTDRYAIDMHRKHLGAAHS